MMCDRWEKNLEALKSGALGDVNSPETLLRYWKAQAEAGYPYAEENVRYFEEMVRKEKREHGMSNFEKIRQMSKEELASFLFDLFQHNTVEFLTYSSAIEYLEEESEDTE